MAYLFRNQNNYNDIPYPSKTRPKATIKTSGCGVCSACNAIDNLFGKHIYSVKQMANFSLSNGGRYNDGTNMSVLINALAVKLGTFKVRYINQSEISSKLPEHLKKGGTAILSTNGGKTLPNGLFSTGGHLYSAVGIGSNMKTIHILDSGYYAGKYNILNRNKYVTINNPGPYLTVDISMVQKASHLGAWLLSSSSLSSSNTSGTKDTSKNKKYLYSNTFSGLNFRKGPSVNANFVAGKNSGKSVIGHGDKVEFLSKNNSWYKIKYRDLTGYAHSSYLQSSKPADKIVTIPKGYNLRSAVGVKSKILKTTTSATKVNLLVNGYWKSDGYNWSRVSISEKWYYVAITFK